MIASKTVDLDCEQGSRVIEKTVAGVTEAGSTLYQPYTKQRLAGAVQYRNWDVNLRHTPNVSLNSAQKVYERK